MEVEGSFRKVKLGDVCECISRSLLIPRDETSGCTQALLVVVQIREGNYPTQRPSPSQREGPPCLASQTPMLTNDLRDVTGTRAHTERPELAVSLDNVVSELASNETLGVEHSVDGVHGNLVLGGISDETLSVLQDQSIPRVRRRPGGN